jgi:hypothetical protein
MSFAQQILAQQPSGVRVALSDFFAVDLMYQNSCYVQACLGFAVWEDSGGDVVLVLLAKL